MKIFAYRRPTTAQVSCTDFTITISPFEGAAQATWDDIDPEKADYIMVPFTFKACVPGLDAQRWYLGGDIMLPFTSKNGVPSGFEVRAELRDSIVKTFLSAFPLYERYPEKHIFIDNGDIDRPPPLLRNSILFKICPSYRDFDVLPLPQPTRDPGPPRSITEASIDVSFQGHVDQHPIRQRLASWSRRQTDLRVEFRSTGQSFFVMEANKRAEMASENFELMLRSKFVLSPRGRGTTSRRFFEILAHGRIPIHISDAAKLPLEGLIDYDRFVVRVPEGFVGLTGEYVREFRLQHDLVEASELARCTYVDYFAPQSFRHFIETSLAVRKL